MLAAVLLKIVVVVATASLALLANESSETDTSWTCSRVNSMPSMTFSFSPDSIRRRQSFITSSALASVTPWSIARVAYTWVLRLTRCAVPASVMPRLSSNNSSSSLVAENTHCVSTIRKRSSVEGSIDATATGEFNSNSSAQREPDAFDTFAKAGTPVVSGPRKSPSLPLPLPLSLLSIGATVLLMAAVTLVVDAGEDVLVFVVDTTGGDVAWRVVVAVVVVVAADGWVVVSVVMVVVVVTVDSAVETGPGPSPSAVVAGGVVAIGVPSIVTLVELVVVVVVVVVVVPPEPLPLPLPMPLPLPLLSPPSSEDEPVVLAATGVVVGTCSLTSTVNRKVAHAPTLK